MCGIAGVFRLDGTVASADAVTAARERLTHRGPDDAGTWSEGPVALGFRRLAILDLELGRQPMRSEDGRCCIVFNGEIYNHPRLSEELKAAGVRYRTRSDTETLLHLLAREGDGALHRLEGMFAFAFWDARKRELLLARDHLGVKPLYYHFDGKQLAFASELRALTALMPDLQLDPAGVRDYLSYGFVHSPRTVLASALKLPPGHFLRLNAHGLQVNPFWELPARAPWAAHGQHSPQGGPSLGEAGDEVERLLIASVRGQLLSDVPVGAFLSGGVDSSLITALMVRAAGRKVSTFSIGFSGARAGLDETPAARAVARFLGTDHHELILPADVLSRVEDLGEAMDEPIADSAILPTYLLARFARQNVKVVLTGEGADELFAGYGRYKAAFLSDQVRRMPPWARGAGAAFARRMGKDRVFSEIPFQDLRGWAQAFAHSQPRELAGVCRADFWRRTERADPLEWLKDAERPHSLNSALSFDLRTVLCDCLLMKADKSTMRAGLEARVPYLDRSLVEYALHLPSSAKIHRLKGKYLLRRLAQKYLPKPLVWRRKHGFIVPWEEWVRSPETRFLDDLVNGGAWRDWGVFEPERIRWILDELRAGSRQVDSGLFFRFAVFAIWLERLKK
ncbi:MAG TPA: asparagine synthase (glutamine-hydrolyzing) [Elusimicrobia bacterium]|nr:asparagine synthase (glutamine-hydrolyzing) [Elusimicrobiota bacterium]